MAMAMAVAVAVGGLRRCAAEAMLWRPQATATAAARARRGYASAAEGGPPYVSDAEMALPITTRFENWMHKYGRTYKDEAEKAFRFEVFKDNVKYIDANRHDCAVGIFADKVQGEVPTGAFYDPAKRKRGKRQKQFKNRVSSASSGMQECGN